MGTKRQYPNFGCFSFLDDIVISTQSVVPGVHESYMFIESPPTVTGKLVAYKRYLQKQTYCIFITWLQKLSFRNPIVSLIYHLFICVKCMLRYSVVVEKILKEDWESQSSIQIAKLLFCVIVSILFITSLYIEIQNSWIYYKNKKQFQAEAPLLTSSVLRSSCLCSS